MEEETRAMPGEIDDLRKDYQQLQTENKDLKAQLVLVENQCQKNGGHAAERWMEIERLKTSNAALIHNIMATDSELIAVQEDCASLQRAMQLMEENPNDLALKKENETLERLRNTEWAETKRLKTEVGQLRSRVERLKELLRYGYPHNHNRPENVVWSEKVEQALKE